MSVKPQLFPAAVFVALSACSTVEKPPIDHKNLASEYFAEDAAWYESNIPFFECSDKEIEQVYYYRWKL
ncbi:MAG TPA: hypothetical protein PKX08_14780, partial [Cyclobacteriaceae bacterium]|nr:hypothetical protein [Cyclobacteriaceae bacterium]